MSSSKKATTKRDTLHYTKTDKENLCKAMDYVDMYQGGIFDARMVFNKKHSLYANTKFYICDKCFYGRECNSVRHAKMIERLHRKKCKGI